MIVTCSISKFYETREVEVTRMNGESAKRTVQGVLLNAGGAEFFAEAFGETADELLERCLVESVISADIELSFREFTTRDGRQGVGTNIRIKAFTVLSRNPFVDEMIRTYGKA